MGWVVAAKSVMSLGAEFQQGTWGISGIIGAAHLPATEAQLKLNAEAQLLSAAKSCCVSMTKIGNYGNVQKGQPTQPGQPQKAQTKYGTYYH